MKRTIWRAVIGLAAVVLAASAAPANTWSGNGENWNDETKWSAGLPVADQAVIIAGNVVLTNATPWLASFTVNAGKTNTCFGWWSAISAEVVTVNGTLTHLPNTDTNGTNAVYPGGWEPDSRVYVVCSNLIVNTGGRIDADAKGYGSSTNATGLNAYGPGGAISANCGGGYGGRGGDYRNAPTGGGTNYGSALAPLDPGSGGARSGTNAGGWGGGAIRIEAAGIVTVNGTITANGGSGLGDNYRGGGSGGSIYMTCGAFAGTNGVVQASGGDVIVGTTGCGGGGGRVALEVTDRTAQQALPLPTVAWSARAGWRSGGSVLWEAGYPGTLYWNAFPLELSASPGGSTDFASAWHTNGATVTIAAEPEVGYAFLQWSGPGVPVGLWTNNPLTVTLDRARTIQANFYSTTPTARKWLGNGGWFSAANWTPQGIPGPFDTVTIDSGTNLLADPATVGSLTISNATLVFTNWMTCLTAGDVNVLTGGLITLPPAFLDEGRPETYDMPMSNRVRVVCSNFTLAAGSRIDADGRGYAGIRPGYPASGPGAVGRLLFNSNRSAGSSHGGLGATRSCLPDNIYFAAPGLVYGTLEAPDAPGSGGSLSSGGTGGGDGGGLVQIEASGHVRVNGTISANGRNGVSGTYVYGGSGGGVFIACHTFASTDGSIGAGGGNGGTVSAAGGGGGRIAVVYHPAAQSALPPPIIQMHARAGLSFANNAGNYHGFRQNSELGTIYLPDTRFLTGEPGELKPYIIGRLFFGSGETSWAADSLTLSNAWMVFPTGFSIMVTNTLLVTTGSDATVKARLGIPNGRLTCGDLIVTNGGGFYVYAGVTNGGDGVTGALVSVAGAMTVFSNAAVYPICDPTNGGAVVFRVGRLTVAAGGGIHADGAGYYDNYGPGAGWMGSSSDVTNNGAGGFGGLGGRAAPSQIGGGIYGSSNGPVHAGSGGGGFSGQLGGGVVWVEAAGQALIDGTVSAQGVSAGKGGAGAGGGISIRSRSISGTGVLRAGGGGNANASRPAGGGGRVVVARLKDAFDHGQASATGGVAVTGGTYNGANGTVVWLQLPAEGTLIMIR